MAIALWQKVEGKTSVLLVKAFQVELLKAFACHLHVPGAGELCSPMELNGSFCLLEFINRVLDGLIELYLLNWKCFLSAIFS